MGPTELDLQTNIVHAANITPGMYAMKMSNKFLAGVPDVLMAMKPFGSVMIEMKKLEQKSDIVLLSPIQMRTFGKMKDAGAKIGVMAMRYIAAGHYEVWVSKEVNRVKLDLSYKRFDKILHKEWPLQEILEFLAT